MVTPGETIKIFLPDGQPDGIKIVEKLGWTGRALQVPRSQWADRRSRDELGRPGVYVLTGPRDDGGSLPEMYIGEGETPRRRIDGHATKEFWTVATLFTSSDENLNKAHLRYLESRLIGLAAAAGRVRLDNGTAPEVPPLAESEGAYAEQFLQNMLLIYPLIGINAFEVPPRADGGPVDDLLSISGPQCNGTGRETSGGFTVYAGSLGRLALTPSTANAVLVLRRDLESNGVIAPEGDSFRMVRDFEFSSPSQAAAFLLARPANGRDAWRDAGGATLNDRTTRTLSP
jgi:hypothetical protein